MNWTVVGLAGSLVLLGAVSYCMSHLNVFFDFWGDVAATRRRRKHPSADQRTIEEIAATLHRLATYLRDIEASDEPHHAARLSAASLAYDQVLREACRILEIEWPDGRGALEPLERLEAEAALAQRGLEW